MKQVLIFVLLGFACALLQTAVFPRFLPPLARPELFVLLIVLLSLGQTAMRGGLIAWLLGLLVDVFAAQTLGLHGFVFLVTFFLIKLTERRLNTESSLLLVLLVFGGTLTLRGLTAITLLMLDEAGRSWRIILRQMPIQALTSALVACALLLLLRWLGRRTGMLEGVPGLRYLDTRYEK
ncbi:rod shape-determining protein MreD [Geoalkalibacter sp.]|uniref:rod shape-determining protein MreD n=1 Tax=Geoalkalibacter sp. TaxID=3041440 RepID=UPI00272E44A1|nr:rod shape-determining protein MreD [Geoalkalibacter sp.]